MKEKISILLFIIIPPLTCSAQQEVQKIISSGTALLASDLKVDHEGNILCSFTDQWINFGIPGVMKLDTSLNILWASEQQFSDKVTSLLFDVTPDNGVVVVGNKVDYFYSHGVMSRIDSSGNLLWAREAYGDYSYFANLYAVAAMPSGNFLVCGAVFDSMVLAKVDGAGNILWKESLSASNLLLGNQIVRANDDEYYITGFVMDSSLQIGGLVMKIDSNGQVLWANNFSTGEDCVVTSFAAGDDSSYYFTLSNGIYGDTAIIVKAISSESISFVQSFNHPYTLQYSNSIAIEDNGNFLLAGVAEDSLLSANTTLAEFSQSNGFLNGSFQFVTGYFGIFTMLTLLPGGSVVIAGLTALGYYDTTDLHSAIYFLKGALPSGNSCNETAYDFTAPVPSVSISNVNVTISTTSFALDTISVSNSFINLTSSVLCSPSVVESTKKEEDFSVYPNPFSESFELNISTAEDATLRVFDVEGNLLFESLIHPSEKISLGENFVPGIYLLQIQTAKGISSGKIVKAE